MSQDPRDPGWSPPHDPQYSQNSCDSSSEGYQSYPPEQPYLPEQPYPVDQPYSPGPQQTPVSRFEKRSAKGVISLCLVLCALGISLMLSWIAGTAMAASRRLRSPDFDSAPDDGSLVPSAADEFLKGAFTLVLQLVPTALGIAALVVGILACKHRNSKRLGIVAIIISVLAPVVSALLFMIAMAPSIEG
ncbi:MAG: YppG family protein [Acidipropionibacterium jensenii]|nr:hypothetical protein [Acidipropionibacterium jensenii]MDN6512435.1 YppG family protein [Acidipropionibacterium jensenii]